MTFKAYIGVAKCCGAISAAMVDDGHIKAKDLGRFTKDVLSTGRELKHAEFEDGALVMQRCKCSRGPTSAPGDASVA